MSEKNSVLGRGLSRLMGEVKSVKASVPTSNHGLMQIPLDALRGVEAPADMDGPAMEELVESVRRYGVLQPILVCRQESGYTVLAGSRRVIAAWKAGLTNVPALAVSATEEQALAIAAAATIQPGSVVPPPPPATAQPAVPPPAVAVEAVEQPAPAPATEQVSAVEPTAAVEPAAAAEPAAVAALETLLAAVATSGLATVTETPPAPPQLRLDEYGSPERDASTSGSTAEPQPAGAPLASVGEEVPTGPELTVTATPAAAEPATVPAEVAAPEAITISAPEPAPAPVSEPEPAPAPVAEPVHTVEALAEPPEPVLAPPTPSAWGRLYLLAALAVLLGIAADIWLRTHRPPATTPAGADTTLQPVTNTPVAVVIDTAPTNAVAAVAPSAPASTPSPLLRWQRVRCGGLRTIWSEREVQFIPEAPLFREGVELDTASEPVLQRLGRVFGVYATNLTVVVVGHVGSESLPIAPPYATAYELGLARALRVTTFLHDACGLTNVNLVATCTPFGNDATVTNNTVTIRLEAGS